MPRSVVTPENLSKDFVLTPARADGPVGLNLGPEFKRQSVSGLITVELGLTALGATSTGAAVFTAADAAAARTALGATSTGAAVFTAADAAAARTALGATSTGAAVFTAADAAALRTMLGFTNSLSPAGRQVLPGGLIWQWQSLTTSTGGGVTWTFPATFPTGCFGGSVTMINNIFGHVGAFDATPSNSSALISTWNGGSRTAVQVFVHVFGW
jgi:hypothetical protein